MNSPAPHKFKVSIAAHLDGRFSVVESNITGLWLETDDLGEMLDEIERVGCRLAEANHGISREEFDAAEIHALVYIEEVRRLHRHHARPQLSYENQPAAAVG